MSENVINYTGTVQADKSSVNWLGDLNPSSIKVDERDMAQQLVFTADYARLINYYDQHNRQNGHWRNFFLKDPMILMAVISRIDYQSIHQQYVLIEQKLATLLTEKSAKKSAVSTIYNLLNRVFELVNEVFLTINEWLGHIAKDQQDYPLKNFIKEKIKTELVFLLQQQLTLQSLLSFQYQGINPPELNHNKNFDPCWQLNAGGTDLGQTQRNIKQILKNTELNQIDLNRLKVSYDNADRIYQNCFRFFVQVIDSAKSVYDIKAQQGEHYPDTALLIAFIKLMEVQQRQLNNMTARHLNFYYQDILKLNKRPAEADEVYLHLTLAKKYQSLDLPVGTDFSAGLDANKKPIVFHTNKSTELSQTIIKAAHTLFYQPKQGLQLRVINTPGQLNKTPQGKIQSWPILGQPSIISEQEIKPEILQQGFAFGSPLLHLQGGKREITLVLTFSQAIEDFFSKASFYFSSEKQWVTPKLPPVLSPKMVSATTKKITLTFTLKANEPSLCAFKKNPDGYQSQWPLFKMLLPTTFNLNTKPPQLVSVKITTIVTDFDKVQGYTATSTLPSTNFKPFGSIAQANDCFYLGSSEMFAKPLSQLDLALSWNNLPFSSGVDSKVNASNFETYYADYNDYIKNPLLPIVLPDKPATSDKKTQPSTFTNESFVISFSILQYSQWQPVILSGIQKINNTVNGFLFATNKNELVPNSQFSLNINSSIEPESTSFLPQPSLLLKPLKFNNKSTDGFIKMQLVKPAQGFGHDLYAKVVNKVTMENALSLIGGAKPKVKNKNKNKNDKENNVVQTLKSGWKSYLPPIIQTGLGLFKLFSAIKKAIKSKDKKEEEILTLKAMPNQPYTPQVESLSITYSASDTTVFNDSQQQDNYPFALYHYGSFNTFQVYDANKSPNQLNLTRLVPGTFTEVLQPENNCNHTEVPLFSGANQGALYLALEGVSPPNTLTLLFQLVSATSIAVNDIPPIDICYLNEAGWQPLTVLNNSTNQFSCSGLIEVQLEPDMFNASALMGKADKEKYYWLSISVNSGADFFGEIVYLNTQVIKAFRSDLSNLPEGEKPSIISEKINHTVKANQSLSAVQQPFPSFNGKEKEDQSAFYHRVSERINNKARSYFPSDYEKMALRACSHFYFARCLTNQPVKSNKKSTQVKQKKEFGKVVLYIAKSVSDINQPDAFNPQINRCDINKTEQYFQQKTPSFVDLQIKSFQLISVTITCQITLLEEVNEPSYIHLINQQLKVYLSPWIRAEQTQMKIDNGLNKGDIIEFILSLPQVVTVDSLTMSTDQNHDVQHLIVADDEILVTAQYHEINGYQG